MISSPHFWTEFTFKSAWLIVFVIIEIFPTSVFEADLLNQFIERD